jgi:hypothetical protein
MISLLQITIEIKDEAMAQLNIQYQSAEMRLSALSDSLQQYEELICYYKRYIEDSGYSLIGGEPLLGFVFCLCLRWSFVFAFCICVCVVFVLSLSLFCLI